MYQTMQHGNRHAPGGVGLIVGTGIINRTAKSVLGQFERVIKL